MMKNDFISEVLLPYYAPMLDCDFMLGIVDSTGNYIFVTNSYASYENSLNNVSFLKACTQKHLKINMSGNDIIAKLNTGVEYLDIIAVDEVYLTSCLPLYYPDMSFFGYEFFMHQFDLKNQMELLIKLTHSHEIHRGIEHSCLTSGFDLKLTDRQAEILFLLMLGFIQHEIADFLKISRNTVKSIIIQGIFPKFGITNHDVTFLIDKSIELKLYLKIPPQLLRMGESRIVARYDNCDV